MKTRLLFGIILLIGLMATWGTAQAQSTVWVDDDYTSGGANDGHTWGTDAFDTIQAGVTAAAGGTVNVLPGLYEEQVVIVDDNTQVVGSGSGTNPASASIIQSPVTLTYSFNTGSVKYPVVGIDGCTGVRLEALRIDGLGRGNTNYQYVGIAFWNAGADVDACHVTGIRDTPFSGAQHGVALYAYNNDGGPYTINVTDTDVDDFQKNATALSGDGLTVLLDGCTFTGSGHTAVTAQNGIQVGFGAGGTINDCVVSDIGYTGGSWTASGMLLYNGTPVDITGACKVLNSQSAVYLIDTSSTIDGLHIKAGDIIYGDGVIAYDAGGVLDSGDQLHGRNFSLLNEPSYVTKRSRAVPTTVSISNAVMEGVHRPDSYGATVYAYGDDVTMTITDSVITDFAIGVVVDEGGSQGFTNTGNTAIAGNDLGFYSFSPGNVQIAQNNWWGDAGGPHDPLGTVLPPPCPGPADIFNDNPAGDLVTDELVAYCPWLDTFPRLTMEHDYECYLVTDTLIVEIWMRDVSEAITGGQFFLNFDATLLTFVSAVPGGGPFTLEVGEVVGADTINYYVGVPFGDPGVTGDAKMAEITFTLGADTVCAQHNMVTWRENDPPTRLTDDLAQPVYPLLMNADAIDDTPPVITCPADITIECDVDSSPAGPAGSATATDNCSIPTVTPVDTVVAGACPAEEVITRTWTAEDDCGNTDVCVQTITVEDTTPPGITCPADITIECDVDPVPANTGTATATDNCSTPTVTFSDSTAAGACPAESVITRTWTATDGCGLTATCDQTITVDDSVPPVIACPADVTIECDASTDPGDTGVATAIDNCTDQADIVFTFSDNDSGLTGCNGTGDLIRTWAATDECGNVSISCMQTITVQDTTPPDIVTPDNITVYADAGGCDAVVTFPMPTVTDSCDGTYQSHFEGFEDPGFTSGTDPGNWHEYGSFINRALSGTDGIASKSGVAHAVITPETGTTYGVYSRLGGYDSNYGDGFTVSLDAYMDLTDPTVVADTYAWDLSTAATDQLGEHLQDFIFHTASNAAGNILVAGSNNTNYTRRNDLAGINNHEITASGWYTFQWVFRDFGDGTLAVDMNLLDGSGTSLWTETRHDSGNILATVVGGNRYMWFTFLETDYLAVDNTEMVRGSGDAMTVTVVPPSGSTFAAGTTTVNITATDNCGNTSTDSFTVTVDSFTELDVDITLDGTVDPGPFTRCITFELHDCGGGGGGAVYTVDQVMTFTGGNATATILVPCDAYDCITARDTLHTLRRTLDPLVIDGADYVADFTSAGKDLVGANFNDDSWVDILDFGVFNLEWNTNYGDGNTDCATAYPHADATGDGLVNTADFTFVTNNFLQGHEADCCGLGPGDFSAPVTEISVDELIKLGLGELAIGDLNNDGLLNTDDVAAFASGVRPTVKPYQPSFGARQ